MKKTMLPVLVLILCSLLSACGGGDTAAETTQAPHPKAGTTNKYGWTVPEKTIEFTVYGGPSTPDPEAEAGIALVDQFLKDEFNVVIHEVNNRQEINEHLNMMLASNSYPDVISSMPDAMAEMFRSQNRAIELTPLLEQHGQNIIEGFGNYLNLLKTDDGKLYKLAWSWGNTTDSRGRDFAIRYDLWKKSGLPLYDSFESFYNVVKTLVAQNPTNKYGERTYGISAFTAKGEEFYQTPLAYMGFKGADTGFYRENPDGTISHWVDTPEGLEVAKYINRFWREGLIDPDFQTKTYEESRIYMGNERVVGNIGTWWHPYVGGHQLFVVNEPETWTMEKRFQNVTFEQTSRTPALISNNFIRTTRVIITDKAKDPEAIMNYFNWEVTPAGTAFSAMGVPGGDDRCWDVDANGDVKLNDYYWYGSYLAADNTKTWGDIEVGSGGMAHWIMAPGYTPQGKDPADGFADPIAAFNMWEPVPNWDTIDLTRLEANKLMDPLNMETCTSYPWDQTMWTVAFPSDAEETMIQQNIKDAMVAEWIRVFTAPTEAECETRFAQMRDNLYRLGLEKLVAYQQAAYQKNVAKFNGQFPIQ